MAQSIPVDDFHRRVTRIVNRTPYYCRYIPYNLNSIPLGLSELISTDDNEVVARVIANAKRLSFLEERDESLSFDSRHSYNYNVERYRLWSWARKKKGREDGKNRSGGGSHPLLPSLSRSVFDKRRIRKWLDDTEY